MIARVGITAMVTVSLLLAFLVANTADETAPAGTRSIVSVWDTGETRSRDDLLAILRADAEAVEVPLYRSVRQLTPSGTTRTLYQVAASTGDDAIADRFRQDGFSRAISTRLEPSIDAYQGSLVGTYISAARAPDARRLASLLIARGFDATVTDVDGPFAFVQTTRSTGILLTLLASALGLVVGVSNQIMVRRRRVALLRASGRSALETSLRGLGGDLRDTAVIAGASLTLALAALGFFNGFSRTDLFLGYAGLGIGVTAASLAAIHLVVGVLPRSCGMAERVAGAIPSRRVTTVGLVSQVAALTIVCCLVSATVPAVSLRAQNTEGARTWSQSSALEALTFRTSDPEFDELIPKIADVAAHAVRRGDALVALPASGPTEGYGPTVGNSIVVSGSYLDRQTITDENGARVTSSTASSDALVLLIPRSLRALTRSIEDDYREWIDFQMTQRLAEHRHDRTATSDIRIDVRLVDTGRHRFTYSTYEPTSVQLDPVIAVLPPDVGFLSDDWLASSASTGSILFFSLDRLRSELRNSSVNAKLVAIDNASQLALVRLAEQDRRIRESSSLALLALVDALLISIIVGAAAASRARRRDILLLASGRSLWRRHLMPAASAGAVAAVAAMTAWSLSGRTALEATSITGCACLHVVFAGAVTDAARRRLQRATSFGYAP